MAAIRKTQENLLRNALKALEQEAGTKIKIMKLDARVEDKRVDALLKVKDHKKLIAAEIRKWAQHVNLGAV